MLGDFFLVFVAGPEIIRVVNAMQGVTLEVVHTLEMGIMFHHSLASPLLTSPIFSH
jgi:hypothetical protein